MWGVTMKHIKRKWFGWAVVFAGVGGLVFSGKSESAEAPPTAWAADDGFRFFWDNAVDGIRKRLDASEVDLTVLAREMAAAPPPTTTKEAMARIFVFNRAIMTKEPLDALHDLGRLLPRAVWDAWPAEKRRMAFSTGIYGIYDAILNRARRTESHYEAVRVFLEIFAHTARSREAAFPYIDHPQNPFDIREMVEYWRKTGRTEAWIDAWLTRPEDHDLWSMARLEHGVAPDGGQPLLQSFLDAALAKPTDVDATLLYLNALRALEKPSPGKGVAPPRDLDWIARTIRPAGAFEQYALATTLISMRESELAVVFLRRAAENALAGERKYKLVFQG